MAWLQKSTVLPACLLGLVLASTAYSLQPPCELVKTTGARGSFQLKVAPLYYRPGVVYTVSVLGVENGTSVILQILSAGDSSEGSWEEVDRQINCSSTENVMQKNFSGAVGTQTRWLAPSATNVGSAQVRAFVTFANGTTLLQTMDLEKELASSASSSAPQPTNGSHRPTLLSSSTDSHLHLNSTEVHHPLASSHQWTKGPSSSVSVAQANSFLFVAMQILSIALGYKLLG